jgi:hypothetical protein
MPTNLLEQQIEVDRASREPARTAAQENVLGRRDQKSSRTPRKTIWWRIFEGHEEFLGLTPD